MIGSDIAIEPVIDEGFGDFRHIQRSVGVPGFHEGIVVVGKEDVAEMSEVDSSLFCILFGHVGDIVMLSCPEGAGA